MWSIYYPFPWDYSLFRKVLEMKKIQNKKRCLSKSSSGMENFISRVKPLIRKPPTNTILTWWSNGFLDYCCGYWFWFNFAIGLIVLLRRIDGRFDGVGKPRLKEQLEVFFRERGLSSIWVCYKYPILLSFSILFFILFFVTESWHSNVVSSSLDLVSSLWDSGLPNWFGPIRRPDPTDLVELGNKRVFFRFPQFLSLFLSWFEVRIHTSEYLWGCE